MLVKWTNRFSWCNSRIIYREKNTPFWLKSKSYKNKEELLFPIGSHIFPGNYYSGSPFFLGNFNSRSINPRSFDNFKRFLPIFRKSMIERFEFLFNCPKGCTWLINRFLLIVATWQQIKIIQNPSFLITAAVSLFWKKVTFCVTI